MAKEKTKKVVVLRPMRGPEGSLAIGDVADLPESTANYLQNCGKVSSDPAVIDAKATKAKAKAKD